jgi:galactitol-specific phosphotransferase system IIB component
MRFEEIQGSSTHLEANLKKFFKSKDIKANVEWKKDRIEIKLSSLNYYSDNFPTRDFNEIINSFKVDYKVVGDSIIIMTESKKLKKIVIPEGKEIECDSIILESGDVIYIKENKLSEDTEINNFFNAISGLKTYICSFRYEAPYKKGVGAIIIVNKGGSITDDKGEFILHSGSGMNTSQIVITKNTIKSVKTIRENVWELYDIAGARMDIWLGQ